MKIVYAGSPEYAVKPLQALVAAGKQVIAVLTQPDRPTGRKRLLTPTPVKLYAQSAGIPVYDFERVKEHAEELASLGADIMITCAYGQLLTQPVLNAFPKGVYNLHASLLPLYRGASPIQAAILSGDEYTGVTVMRTELSLDSGDILLVRRTPVSDRTCGELSIELSDLSARAAVEATELIERGGEQLLLQDEARATYCKKLQKQDARIDFSKPAKDVKNLINAMSPSPAAYCNFNGSTLNLLKAAVSEGEGESGSVLSVSKSGVVIACGRGAVSVSRLQFAGGKPVTAADALNGRKIKAGDYLD